MPVLDPHTDLLYGDVLLYDKKHWLYSLVSRIDGTPVNHVSLATGAGMIAVANPEGIVRERFAKSAPSAHWVSVHRPTLGSSGDACRHDPDSSPAAGSR